MKNAEQPINALPSDVDSSKIECIGLTKREYFAGLAMQGLLANNSLDAELTISKKMAHTIAKDAISVADELLKQLDNEPTTKL